jgi:thymidylate synthase
MSLNIQYHKENLLFGEREDVGILALWTKKEHIAKKVDKSKYGVLGQLYSKDEGISTIIRNCLANKNIRHIILCGIDLYNSGEALLALVKHGVDDQHTIIGVSHAVVQQELPLQAINTFRSNVQVHDCRNIKDYAELNAFIDTLEKLPSYGIPEQFPEPQLKQVDSWPTDPVGFKIVGKTVGETWLDVLDTIMKFGVKKQTEYGNAMKEVINIVTVVTDKNTQNIAWKEYFNFTPQELEQYIPKILSNVHIKDVEYTYGQRLREHFGKDQIQGMVEYLKKAPYTRRAVAVTWDVQKDLGNTKAPCLDLIQCIVQEEKLYMTVYFRSNDMFDAWPRNALALRRLQETIAGEIGKPVGSLCIVSSSAHIYEGAWKQAQTLVDKHKKPPQLELDPRGNNVITIDQEQKEIVVKHYSPQGGILNELRGRTARDLINKIITGKSVSLISHGLYLGRELHKAQTALEQGIEYQQDRELEFSR